MAEERIKKQTNAKKSKTARKQLFDEKDTDVSSVALSSAGGTDDDFSDSELSVGEDEFFDESPQPELNSWVQVEFIGRKSKKVKNILRGRSHKDRGKRIKSIHGQFFENKRQTICFS